MGTFQNLKNINRNLVYLVVAIIVVGCMLLTKPQSPNKPRGLFLPATNQLYSAQPDTAVKVYDGNTSAPLLTGKVIGQIRAELHFEQMSQTTETEVLEYAKHLAAQSGATGLAVNTFFGTPQPGLDQRYIFIGQAIKY